MDLFLYLLSIYILGNRTLKDANKRYQFRAKNYGLDVHCRVNRTVNNQTKLVIWKEKFFEVIYEVHAVERSHQGILKTFEQLNTT